MNLENFKEKLIFVWAFLLFGLDITLLVFVFTLVVIDTTIVIPDIIQRFKNSTIEITNWTLARWFICVFMTYPFVILLLDPSALEIFISFLILIVIEFFNIFNLKENKNG